MLRIATILLSALAGLAGPASAAQGPCTRQTLQQHAVVVCIARPQAHAIRTLWKDARGTPYGSLSGIASTASPATGPMLFAMNAGMYHPDLTPVGLYIENGTELHRANTNPGPGNFHMRPNGVFYVAGRTAGVMETQRFLKSRIRADFASQSGPMLLIDGKLHPRINGQGTSAKIRNGVGIRADGTAVFVISDEPVTFSAFARMFRDDLKTRNALYFDGSISSLYAPSAGRADRFMPVGPIVAVFGR